MLSRAWFSLSQRMQRVANATPLPAMNGLLEVPFIVVSSVCRTSVHPDFSDFESKQIWALTQSDRQLVKVRQIGSCLEKPASFGVDSLVNC